MNDKRMTLSSETFVDATVHEGLRQGVYLCVEKDPLKMDGMKASLAFKQPTIAEMFQGNTVHQRHFPKRRLVSWSSKGPMETVLPTLGSFAALRNRD